MNIGGDMVFVRVPDFSITNESRMEIWKAPALTRFHDDRKVAVVTKVEDANGKVKKSTKWVNPVPIFAAQAKRHSRVEFAPPPARIPATAFNLFGGFHLKPLEGDCSDLKAFIRDVVCAGNEATFKWVWHWLAHLVQRPGEKPGTALVLHGAGGAGKGTFGELVRALVYPYLRPFANKYAADSDNVMKLAEKLFGKDHGFIRSKGLVDVPSDKKKKNLAYFEFPAGDVLRARMVAMGYEF